MSKSLTWEGFSGNRCLRQQQRSQRTCPRESGRRCHLRVMPSTSFLSEKPPEDTGEPPEGIPAPGRAEQPGIDTAGHGRQHSHSVPWLRRQNSSTCSSIPDCLTKHKPVASCTVQLLSQHQMTKKKNRREIWAGEATLGVFMCRVLLGKIFP